MLIYRPRTVAPAHNLVGSVSRRSACTTVVGVLVLIGLTTDLDPPSPNTASPNAVIHARSRVSTDAIALDPRFIEPKPSLETAGPPAWSLAPLPSEWRPVAPRFAASARTRDLDQPVASAVQPPRLADASIPLPVPRPSELGGGAESPRLSGRAASRRAQVPAVAPPDNRSFLEKLFGVQPAPAPALTYATLDPGPVTIAPAPRLAPAPILEGGTAVYDISARSVTLPSGEKLEAHSGLGDRLDDPRSVKVRMRGATPPGEYELSEREQLFHGVRALRLNPVGGNGAVFGRAGLLAHTFMLGPNGDSNGCVSFRDYERFFQAYLRGEVKRLVVVAGSGGDRGPSFFNRQFGMPDRSMAPRTRDT